MANYDEKDDRVLAVVGELQSGRDIIRVLIGQYKNNDPKIRIYRLYTDRRTGEERLGRLGGLSLAEAEDIAGLLVEAADKMRTL